jgi:hypothetical protein
MNSAIKPVKENKGVRAAGLEFRVPCTTLHDRVKDVHAQFTFTLIKRCLLVEAIKLPANGEHCYYLRK